MNQGRDFIVGLSQLDNGLYFKICKLTDRLNFTWVHGFEVEQSDQDIFYKLYNIMNYYYFQKGTQTVLSYNDEIPPNKMNVNQEENVETETYQPKKMPETVDFVPKLEDFHSARDIKNSYVPIKVWFYDVNKKIIYLQFPDQTEKAPMDINEAMVLYPSLIAEYFAKNL